MASAAITANYRGRLAAGSAGLHALLRALWGRIYDPQRPIASLAMLGALAGILTTRQQAAAVTTARGYLAALVADASGTPLAGVAPFPMPAGLIGAAANGSAIPELTGLAPAVYWRRIGLGQPPGDAAGAALSWLNRVAASEPYRAANVTVNYGAFADGRLTGRVRRETAADACQWCKDKAARGYVSILTYGDFYAHSNCRCTASPQIRA